MKRNLISGITAILLLGSLTQYTFAFQPLVKTRSITDDITSDSGNYRFFDAVKWGYERSVFDGFHDGVNAGKFAPDANVTRAEFLKMLFRAVGQVVSPSDDSKCFSDSSVGSWWNPYACVAKKNGYVGGYSDGTFRPNWNITVAEAYKMFTNAFGINASQNISSTFVNDSGNPTLQAIDAYSVNKSGWAFSYLQNAHNLGIGFDNYYPSTHCESYIFHNYTGPKSACDIDSDLSSLLTRWQMANLLFQANAIAESKNTGDLYLSGFKAKDGASIFSVLSSLGQKIEVSQSRLDSIVKGMPVTVDAIQYNGAYFYNGLSDAEQTTDVDGNTYSRTAVLLSYNVAFHVGSSEKTTSKAIKLLAVFEDGNWKILNDYGHFLEISIDTNTREAQNQCDSPSLKVWEFLGMHLETNASNYNDHCTEPYEANLKTSGTYGQSTFWLYELNKFYIKMRRVGDVMKKDMWDTQVKLIYTATTWTVK